MKLAVTTREMNPGDDFILNGIRSLYPDDTNWAIYNRNPDNKLIVGNQWTGHSLDIFDQVIVAGSPQWYGDSVFRLYESLMEKDTPISFFGIGVGESGVLNLSELDIQVLQRAKNIVTRGEVCKQQLAEHGIQSTAHVCPAIFAGKPEIVVGDRVCGVLTVHRPNKTNKTITVDEQVEIFRKLNSEEVIVHHLDEVEIAKKLFNKVWYTYNPDDYANIYRRFDIIVSSRLHGAIFGISHGRPSFLIDVGSKRCQDAAAQIPLLDFCDPAEVIKKIDQFDVKLRSEQISQFIQVKKQEYQSLCNPTLQTIKIVV